MSREDSKNAVDVEYGLLDHNSYPKNVQKFLAMFLDTLVAKESKKVKEKSHISLVSKDKKDSD